MLNECKLMINSRYIYNISRNSVPNVLKLSSFGFIHKNHVDFLPSPAEFDNYVLNDAAYFRISSIVNNLNTLMSDI